MTQDQRIATLPADAPLLAPLAGDAPAGADPANDPDFAALQIELDKLTRVSGASPDWPLVHALAARVLTSRAKDLRAATWLAAARFHERAWGGLRDALAFLAAFAEDWAATCFPPRPRARANQWVWLSEHLERAIERCPDPPAEDDVVARCLSLAESLSEAIARHSDSRDVLLARLLDALRRRAPAERAEPLPEPDAVNLEPIHDATPRPKPEDDRAPTVSASVAALIHAATAARARDPADESAYRLLRVALYLAASPPTAQDRRSALAAPPTALREQLRKLAAVGAWGELAERAESALERHLWWLDLHRWTAMALDQRGGRFQAARASLGREVVHTLLRFPSVTDLEFADGAPLCDVDTRAWLAAERLQHLWGRTGAERADLAAESDALLRLQGARDLAAAGDAVEGLRVAVGLANRAPDPRARFRMRLAAARLALDHKLLAASRSLLDALLADADAAALKLDAWEPELCARLYEALLECAVAQGAGRDKKLHERLYRIDPAAAVRFDDVK